MKYSLPPTSKRNWLPTKENIPPISRKKWLRFGQDRLFQLALAVLVGKFQEVECVFVFDCKLRLVSNVLWKCGVEVRLIGQRLLVGLVHNLVDQDVFGPAELLRPFKVESSLGRILAPFQDH